MEEEEEDDPLRLDEDDDLAEDTAGGEEAGEVGEAYSLFCRSVLSVYSRMQSYRSTLKIDNFESKTCKHRQ